MEAFTTSRVGGSSLGELLREARNNVGIELHALAHATHVQEKYILAFEANDQKSLPEVVYQRMFLKRLGNVLQLDEQTITQKHDLQLSQQIGVLQISKAPPKTTSRFAFFVAPRLVSALIVVLIVFLGIAGLGLEVFGIVSPPGLQLKTPSDGEISAVSSLSIEGNTDRGAELRVNGELVYLDARGVFTEIVNLHRGVNVIKISAKKIHSDERVLYRRVLWNGSEAANGNSPTDLGRGGVAAVSLHGTNE